MKEKYYLKKYYLRNGELHCYFSEPIKRLKQTQIANEPELACFRFEKHWIKEENNNKILNSPIYKSAFYYFKGKYNIVNLITYLNKLFPNEEIILKPITPVVFNEEKNIKSIF
jgi:hypothetical protein